MSVLIPCTLGFTWRLQTSGGSIGEIQEIVRFFTQIIATTDMSGCMNCASSVHIPVGYILEFIFRHISRHNEVQNGILSTELTSTIIRAHIIPSRSHHKTFLITQIHI